MSASNITEPKLRKWMVIISTCSILRVLYNLNGFLLLLLCLGWFSTCLIIVLVSTLFIIIFLYLFVWALGPNVSLPTKFMADFTFIPIIMISIIVPFYALLSKCDSNLWWDNCTWITLIAYIKKLLCLNHVFRVVIIHFGVICIQLFDNTDISSSKTLENEGTYQVLLFGCLLYNLFIFWVKDIVYPYWISPLCYYIHNCLIMNLFLGGRCHIHQVINFFKYSALDMFNWCRV